MGVGTSVSAEHAATVTPIAKSVARFTPLGSAARARLPAGSGRAASQKGQALVPRRT
jgi:hypothetical protein